MSFYDTCFFFSPRSIRMSNRKMCWWINKCFRVQRRVSSVAQREAIPHRRFPLSSPSFTYFFSTAITSKAFRYSIRNSFSKTFTTTWVSQYYFCIFSLPLCTKLFISSFVQRIILYNDIDHRFHEISTLYTANLTWTNSYTSSLTSENKCTSNLT